MELLCVLVEKTDLQKLIFKQCHCAFHNKDGNPSNLAKYLKDLFKKFKVTEF